MPANNQNNWETDPEYIDLLNYVIRRTENVESPMSIRKIAREFKEKSGATQALTCLNQRIKRVRPRIHNFVHIDRNTKVRMLFALSASVDAGFLEELKKDAIVEVDEKKRIIHYKANDGSLELIGYHSKAAKIRTVMLESKRSYCAVIIDFFKNKNNADAIPKNEEEKEIWKLIEFIIKKCETIGSPLNIRQSARDFIEHFGISRLLSITEYRIRTYGREIQKIELLDTPTKVKQLIRLSTTLNSNFLKDLRKDAVVEVDELNRITKYAANDGSLTLYGDHSFSTKANLGWSRCKMNKKAVMKQCSCCGDEESGPSEEESEESESEFDSDDENDHLNETQESSSSGAIMSSSSSYTRLEMGGDDRRKRKNSSITAATPEKKRIKEPFHGSIQEDQKEIKKEDDIEQIPKPPQSLDGHNQVEDIWIKIEQEEPVKDSTEYLEVKPETFHNSKIKFFKAMKSLILFLDTPSLSKIQSKIRRKIRETGGSHEVILNNKIVVIMELLISRMTYHSVTILSVNMESVNLSNFLCYLKASILNSKMSGMQGLVENISKLIEESQNKRIPMEKVANALLATLDTYGF